MLREIQDAFATAGLKLNASKCEIQTNAHPARTPSHLDVDGVRFPVVSPQVGFKVLGVQLALANGMAAELDARIACAWGKFHEAWPLLRRRDTSLAKRLRLFDAKVGAAALWCCESWTLTRRQKQRLRSTERAMLRRFAGPRCNAAEEYIPWIKRATHCAESKRDEVGIKSWVEAYYWKKWSWAGHIARNDAHRWTCRLTKWRDHTWWSSLDHRSSACRPLRARAGHFQRWESDLVKLAGGSWFEKSWTLGKAAWNLQWRRV